MLHFLSSQLSSHFPPVTCAPPFILLLWCLSPIWSFFFHFWLMLLSRNLFLRCSYLFFMFLSRLSLHEPNVLQLGCYLIPNCPFPPQTYFLMSYFSIYYCSPGVHKCSLQKLSHLNLLNIFVSIYWRFCICEQASSKDFYWTIILPHSQNFIKTQSGIVIHL